LYFLIEDKAENKTRALHAGAKRLAKAAPKMYPRNKRVAHEGRDLLTQIGRLNLNVLTNDEHGDTQRMQNEMMNNE
jgi:hypothetical protein